MTTTNMTFEEFQATKREATAAQIEETGYNISPPPDQSTFTTDIAGYLYHGNLVIESTKDWRAAYYLLLENRDWESNDLVELERELFRYAVSSDWIRATCANCHRRLVYGGEIYFRGNDMLCSACEPELEEEAEEPRMELWKELLNQVEAVTVALEDAPAPESDKEHVLRVDLANLLASARRILRAMTNDEEMKKPENERELIP